MKSFSCLKAFLFCFGAILILSACGGQNIADFRAPAQSPEIVQPQTPATQNPNALFPQTSTGQPSSGQIYPGTRPGAQQGNMQQANTLYVNENPPRNVSEPVKVALLLPLSGPRKEIGQALLQAAQLALFDMNYDQFELVPIDTKGTARGAAEAGQKAVQDNVSLILGPLYADSVRAVQTTTRFKNIPIVTFSTDWTLSGFNTYVMGFLPFAQVNRLVDYMQTQNIRSAGMIAPYDQYGNAVAESFQKKSRMAGIQTTKTLRFSSTEIQTLNTQIKGFAEADRRESLLAQGMDPASIPLPFEAVFMPVGGDQARIIASSLSFHGLTPDRVLRLGTGLWDDSALARENNLQNAVFAAPSPRLRERFEQRYSETYGNKPPRLASLSYDATSLAIVLARLGHQRGVRDVFNQNALTNPNGFSGIDGIFRFGSNGLVERGLSILQIKNGRIVEIEPAAQTFKIENVQPQSPYINTRF